MSASLGRYAVVLKSSGAYALAEAVGRSVSILLIPVYTRYLTSADYGILDLIDTSMSVLALLLGVRIGQALYYFYAKAEDAAGRDQVLSAAFFCSMLLMSVAVALNLLDASWFSRKLFGDPSAGFALRLAVVNLSLSVPIEFGLSRIRAANDTRAYMRAAIARTLAAASLNVLFLVGFRMGYIGILWSTFITSSALASFLLWRTLAPVRITFVWRPIGAMFRYMLPLGLSGIAIFVVNFADRYFLNHYGTLSEVGIYSLAYRFGMSIVMLHGPFEMYWISQMHSIAAGEGGEKMYVRLSTYLIFVLGAAALLLALFLRPLASVLVGPDFQDCVIYAPWIAAAYVLRAGASAFRNVFLLENRTDLDSKTTIASAMICLAAYAVLIPRWRIWGATCATVIGFLALAVFAYLPARRLRPMPHEFGRWARLAVALACGAAVPSILRPGFFWSQILAGFAGLAVFAAALWIAGFFADDEKRAVSHVLSGLRRRHA